MKTKTLACCRVPSPAVLLGGTLSGVDAHSRQRWSFGPENFRYLKSVAPIALWDHPRIVTRALGNSHLPEGTPRIRNSALKFGIREVRRISPRRHREDAGEM